MSDTFQCGDNTALVSFLYDECEPGERAAIDAHIAVCAACAAEVAALRSARLQLASWTPPEADLGFAIVRPQASGLRAEGWDRSGASDSPGLRGLKPGPWFRQPMPAWAQAAAACLIFGAGLSLGVLRGTSSNTLPSGQVAAGSNVASPGTVTATDLSALEQRLRAEMAELRAVPASTTAAAPQGNNAQMLAQVRALIDESEQRQQRELALRTAQVIRDFVSQRQLDLAQIQSKLGQIEGLAGAEVREQRQMLNYLVQRVSEQR
jgi:anti-sigma factor ChrR (cupin superfamily)